MGQIVYPCGCKFKTLDRPDDEVLHFDKLEGELPRIDVDIYNLNMNCAATWKLFSRGDTKGVFQLESYLGKTWAKKVVPTGLEDLAALVALLRPGCLKAMSGDPPKSMTQRYADRKHRLEDVSYYHPSLQAILDKTYGVLVYQEQAMKIAVVLAGFNEQEADVLRKAIGKKKPEIMAAIESDFVNGCLKVELVDETQAKEIFGWIKESQRYSFNKSHAACYGLDAYWTAFCKAHFPQQFYCAYLEGSQWKQDTQQEVYELVNDAKLNGINIAIPDFRDLQEVNYIKGDTVYFSLGNIKGIGAAALRKLRQETLAAETTAGKKIASWEWLDFLFYLSAKVSSTVVQALIMVGALDYFKVPRAKMLYEFQAWEKLSDKEKIWIQSNYLNTSQPLANLTGYIERGAKVKKEGGACHDQRRLKTVKSILSTLEHPPHSLTDTADMIAWHEEQLLGAPITCHKVDACADASHANTTCKEIIEGKSGYTVLAVEVASVRELVTKRGKTPGKKMAALSLSDASCSLDNAVAFPDVWAESGSMLYEGNTVLVQGERDRKQGGFIIKKVWQI